MNRIHLLLVAVIATTVCAGSTIAEKPSDKFGRGRLLRKWRDDLIGKTEKQNQQNANKNKKQPTPAKRPANGQTPTPARRPAAMQTSANQTKGAQQPALSNKEIQSRRKTVEKFGMLVQKDSKGRFFVAQTSPKGNAVEAGVQRGDQLIQIGGTDLESIEEFYEISGILGEGDAIEFQISRRGQKKTVMISYGEAPQGEATEEIASSKTKATQASAKNRYGYQGKSSKDFRSVLDRSGSFFRSNSKK